MFLQKDRVQKKQLFSAIVKYFIKQIRDVLLRNMAIKIIEKHWGQVNIKNKLKHFWCKTIKYLRGVFTYNGYKNYIL